MLFRSKEGDTKTFYPSGKVKFSVPFKKGLEDGNAFEYNDDGTIITVMDYKVGFMRAQEKINRRDQNKLKQGKWKEFVTLVFQNKKITSDTIDGAVANLGIDIDDFKKCLEENRYELKTKNDFEEGNARGVVGSPTFFVNGKEIVGAQPYETFKTAIDGEIASISS